MPIRKYSLADALGHRRDNRYFRWAGADVESAGDSPTHAARRIGAPYLETETKVDRRISPSGVFTVGSCFAREIENAFVARGFPVLSRPPLINNPIMLNEGGRPDGGYLNRYNTASMLLEFQRCFDRISLKDTDLLNESGEGLYQDVHFTKSLGPSPLEVCTGRRALMKEVGQGARNAHTFVLTLGLNEVWFDCYAGRYLNVFPHITRATPRDRYELHTFSVSENVDFLRQIDQLLSEELDHDYRMIVTVSPVALDKTFLLDDVIVANSEAKSTLRAAAAEFCLSSERASYFQSYEIAMYSDIDSTFKPDRKHVNRPMVDHIVSTFLRDFVLEEAVEPA